MFKQHTNQKRVARKDNQQKKKKIQLKKQKRKPTFKKQHATITTRVTIPQQPINTINALPLLRIPKRNALNTPQQFTKQFFSTLPPQQSQFDQYSSSSEDYQSEQQHYSTNDNNNAQNTRKQNFYRAKSPYEAAAEENTTEKAVAPFLIHDTVNMTPREQADPYTLARRMITYWFQDYERGQMVSDACRKKWFIGHPLLDKYMVYEFGADYMAYKDEKLSANPGPYSDLERHPLGSMALAILSYQFPRAQLRLLKAENGGVLTPEMLVQSHFGPTGRLSQDTFMENIYNAIQTLHPLRYDVIERVHYFLPLLAIENVNTQKVAVARISDLVDEAPRQHRPFLTAVKEFALAHLDTIQLFGRFPQRNQLIGRESTQRELEWLKLHTSHWEEQFIMEYIPDEQFEQRSLQKVQPQQQSKRKNDAASAFSSYSQFLQKTQQEKVQNPLEEELAFKPKNPNAWKM